VTRDDAQRGNLREHGEPARGLYFGRDPKRPTDTAVLVSIAREARAIRLRDTAGNTVTAFGDTTKFWLAAEPVQPNLPAATPSEASPPAAPAGWTRPPKATPIPVEQRVAARAGLHAALAAAGELLAARTAELARSYRLTAGAIDAANGIPGAQRQTWAAAGRPATFLFHERDIRPGRPILATTRDGARIHDARTGTLIAHYASPVAMWIAAAPVPAAPATAPVVIVGCGSAKAPGRLPAGRKYVGSFHSATRRAAAVLAARAGGQVLILSARYGLLTLDTEVDDYDLQIGDPEAVTPAQIAEQAAALAITGAAVTVLAGRRYADLVSSVWPNATRPLDGARGIGEQRARLKAITDQAADATDRDQHSGDGPP
jgi:hypothetical protein